MHSSLQSPSRSSRGRAASSCARRYRWRGFIRVQTAPPTLVPRSLPRWKVFYRPRNFPRSRKRKRFSPRWRDELIEGSGRRPGLARSGGPRMSAFSPLLGAKRTVSPKGLAALIYDGVDAPPTASMCQSGDVEHHLREACVSEVTTIGLDIAKYVFHAHGVDERGRAIFSKRISRGKLLDFFAAQPSCKVAL